MMTAALPASATVVTLASSRDDTVNDRARIQAALDAVAADGGGEVYLTHGNYYIGPPEGGTGHLGLQLSDNVHLHLHQDAVLIRRFEGGATHQATIVNAGGASGNSNIRVSGGTITTAAESEDFQGKHLGFNNVTALTVDHVRFLRIYASWNCYFRDCEDVTISDVTIGDGVSEDDDLTDDGLHFSGGTRITVTNCNIFSGDDCIALTHEDFEDGKNQKPLTYFTASNCTLTSVRAHAIRLLVNDYAMGTPERIQHVRFSDIVARVGVDPENFLGGGIDIQDLSGEEDSLITDIDFNGISLNLEYNNSFAAYIRKVERLRLLDVKFIKPKRRVAINESSFVDLVDCVVEGPRDMVESCVTIGDEDDCEDIRIHGGDYAGGVHGVIIGGGMGEVTRFMVADAAIHHSVNFGLYIYRGEYGLVEGNRIYATSTGIVEDANSDFNTIIANQLAENSTPMTSAAADSELIRNTADVGQEIPDTGGFRQTIDGWIYNDVPSNMSTPDELSRNNLTPLQLGRFRAARNGSVTGIVITSTANVTAGSITVTAYKNTGLAGATSGSIVNLGFSVSLSTGSRNAEVQAKGIDTFEAGDELFLMVTSSSGLMPGNNDIRCAIEIED